MVKGISKQVILVNGSGTELFEQAIFVLKDNAEGITDAMLLKEAKRMINTPKNHKRFPQAVWAGCGAAVTGIIWLITIFL